MDVAFDHWIGSLYRAGAHLPPEHFRVFALESLRDWVPFDGAIWGDGTVEALRFHTLATLDIPDGFGDALEASRDSNPLLPAILGQLGQPFTMRSVCPDATFYNSELYETTFAPFGVERILSTALTNERGGLYTLLSLYRRDRDQPFTDDEIALQARAVFHLTNAASHLVFTYLNRQQNDVPDNSAAAVCDDTGTYHEVQSRFLDLIDRHFDAPPRGRLPFPVEAHIQRDDTINDLRIRIRPLGDLIVVRAWPSGPLDALTVRERQVVQAIAHGLTFKEVARRLGVAPSTVSNHLYRVYDKLGVHSRSALAKLVYDKHRA